ncbi:MAG: ATP-binding response regulator [Thiobacillus sp.]
MLVVALLPALLAEFGMAAYFTTQALRAAGRDVEARAAAAAGRLAAALPPALANGDLPLVRDVIENETRKSGLAFARVVDAAGNVVAQDGGDAADVTGTEHYRQRVPLRPPSLDARASLQTAGANSLAYVEVGATLGQGGALQRDVLMHAALLMAVALALTGALAWRLSSRLASQLRHVGQVVERLACDDLTVRTRLPPYGELGALAAGINNMAEALQRHRSELEQRVREATANLTAKKIMAERANHAKSRFFAAASHDLRQPLHALSLFVAALKARNAQAETQTLIDNIEASTAAMELLFNALLDISRLDAGAIEAHPVHFSLHKMLVDLEQQFGAVAAEKQLRLRFRPCDATVYSDPLLVERILANLIANAIRYTDDGGVLVGCRRRGRTLRISVVDTGRGIPPDQQQSVFQEFVQLHNPARDRSKGLGLGLAIVSRLGRLLGHRVDLRSVPARGSVFSIDVPLGDAALIRAPAPSTTHAQIPADALVVLVDDESAILRGMAELFDNWGIDLVTAHSADEAEQWLATVERVPDVIVSDYRLPDDDGIAVIARLRQRFARNIPAILVTGDTAPDTILRINRAGLPLLHKPLRPAKLRALLTHLIRQSRSTPVG